MEVQAQINSFDGIIPANLGQDYLTLVLVLENIWQQFMG